MLRGDSGLSETFEFAVMWVWFYIALILNEMGEISFACPGLNQRPCACKASPLTPSCYLDMIALHGGRSQTLASQVLEPQAYLNPLDL